MTDAVVLLAKGGYGDWPQEELDRMAAAVRRSGRYHPVVGAFIEQGSPNLPQALEECAAAGAGRILVAPVFVPMDRTLRIWLPQLLRRWLRRRSGPSPEVVLAESLGDRDALGTVALEAVDEAAQTGGEEEIAPEIGADYANPGWSVIPAHRYHALVCTGPRCATRGSLELYHQLRDRLLERGLTSGEGRVMAVRTGCLFPCNLGPMMVVYPDDAWYCGLTAEALDEIVEQHFARGQVVRRYARRPGPERHEKEIPAPPDDIVEDPPAPGRTRRPAAAAY